MMGKKDPHQDPGSRSSSEEAEEEEVYVVEAIKASRWDSRKNQTRYLIKWQGYGDHEMTWEPAPNLNCPELLAAFEADQRRKEALSKSRSQTPNSTRSPNKSLSASTKAAATPLSLKGKYRAIGGADEESDSNEVTIAELDERRAQAKKKAASERRTSSATRAEDNVASKWERKSAKKTPSSRSKPASSDSSGSKAKETTADHRRLDSQQNRKRPRSDPTTVASSVHRKGPIAILQEESSASDEPLVKRISRIPAETVSGEGSAPVAKSSIAQTGDSRPISSASQKISVPTSSRSTAVTPATNPLRAMQFKRKPPVLPPPTQQPGVSIAAKETSGTSSVVVPRAPSPIAQSLPSPSGDAESSRPQTGLKTSVATKPSVRFADDSDSTHGGVIVNREKPAAVATEDPSAAAALAAARDVEFRKQRLAGLESRLKETTYYRDTPVFHQKSMAAACADAVRIGHGNVLRMKGRGVAIICESGKPEVMGEGIALGLLLMMVGARTPNQLTEVRIVCLHRGETLVALEKMYNELVNMEDHHVEFLHFGNNLPVEPILISGFLVIPALSALQQGMAVESFCFSSHQENARRFTVLAHPASIALAQARLPQWQKIMHTLGNCSIPVADKQELSLSSPFAGIDKTSLLNAGQTGVPVPSVTSQSEIAEITSLLCRKREAEPAKWRRFVVVVDREDPTVADLAKQRGVELCTWVGLSEMSRECLF